MFACIKMVEKHALQWTLFTTGLFVPRYSDIKLDLLLHVIRNILFEQYVHSLLIKMMF